VPTPSHAEDHPRHSDRHSVHILWGEQDAWIPAQHGRRLAELIPTARFELIAGAEHLVQHDAPVVLADRIRRWLVDDEGS
jgi:pimeloyl-ACP methyl ester carboxylesterase